MDDQVSVDAPPPLIVLGVAEILTFGVTALAETETVADCAALPPVPVQVNVYVALAVRAPVDCDPCTGFVPDQAPEAAHAVALVADQFNVALPPLVTALGPTLKATVGADDVMEIVTD